MFAYDFSPEAETLALPSGISVQAFLLALVNANSFFTTHERIFAIDELSANILSSSIANILGVPGCDVSSQLAVLVADQDAVTCPLVITGIIASKIIAVLQCSELLFSGLSDKECGSLISYTFERATLLWQQIPESLGVRFIGNVFHCAQLELGWRDVSPFEFRSYDPHLVSDSLKARVEPLVWFSLELGRTVQESNNEHSSHLLAQAIGRAIGSFCVSQNPES